MALSRNLREEISAAVENPADWKELIALFSAMADWKRNCAKRALYVGMAAKFTSGNDGRVHQVTVTKVCPKTVRATEVLASGQKILWKVSPQMLTAL